jgi:hypothetical protein
VGFAWSNDSVSCVGGNVSAVGTFSAGEDKSGLGLDVGLKQKKMFF